MTQLARLPEDEILRKLNRLHNYGTLYEVVLSNGTDTYRVGYCSRSFSALCRMASKRAERINVITGDAPAYCVRPNYPREVGPWHIFHTGRTEREAICNGVWPRLPESGVL